MFRRLAVFGVAASLLGTTTVSGLQYRGLRDATGEEAAMLPSSPKLSPLLQKELKPLNTDAGHGDREATDEEAAMLPSSPKLSPLLQKELKRAARAAFYNLMDMYARIYTGVTKLWPGRRLSSAKPDGEGMMQIGGQWVHSGAIHASGGIMNCLFILIVSTICGLVTM